MPDLSKFNVSPPPMRELAAREARRKSMAPAATGPGAGAGSATKEASSARFEQWSSKASAGQAEGEGSDEDEFTVNNPSSGADPAEVAAARGTLHWGVLSNVIKADALPMKVSNPSAFYQASPPRWKSRQTARTVAEVAANAWFNRSSCAACIGIVALLAGSRPTNQPALPPARQPTRQTTRPLARFLGPLPTPGVHARPQAPGGDGAAHVHGL